MTSLISFSNHGDNPSELVALSTLSLSNALAISLTSNFKTKQLLFPISVCTGTGLALEC